MAFPNGPMATMAPSLIRLAQFVQRKKMTKQGPPQEPRLPGEPPMSQQIAQANSLQIDPRLLPPTPPPQPLPPAPPVQGGAPMPDDMGRAPSPRIAQLAGQAQTPQPSSPSFPQPEPLNIPERTYDMPPVVDPPTLAPAPRRNVAKESNRAIQSALIPAGLGLLLGGAPGALAAASGAVAGNRARADQEAAVENQAFQVDRANTLQQYGMDRQKSGDELARVSQQMRVDATKDNAMYRAKHEEWVAWNKEQDRLAKARTLEGGDTTKTVSALMAHLAKTNELMSTQPEDKQRWVAGNFNGIAAALGHPEINIAIPSKGPVFVMQPKDVYRGALSNNVNAKTAQVPVLAGNTVAKTQAEIDNINADNTRADKDQKIKEGQVKFDQWHKTRQVEVAQGNLDLAKEKANLQKESGSVKSWEDAQGKIATYMAKAATLRRGHVNPVTGVGIVPPSPEEIIAAFNHEDAADSLGSKFGKVRVNGRYVNVDMSPSVGQGDVRASDRTSAVTLPPIHAKGQTVRVSVPTPAPSIPSANNRLKNFAKTGPTPAPKPRPTPAPKKATITPKPTPKPASKMTREEIAREIALEFAKTSKKK